MHRVRVCAAMLAALFLAGPGAYAAQSAARPGARVMMDAHNCYPYDGRWNNRIERALAAGTPVAIEQDLYWYTDPKTGKSWSVVAHGAPLSGEEPTMETYFFDHVRPMVERALREGNHGNWPIITLNLDVKTEQPAHLRAIWKELKKHEDWITTAVRTKSIDTVSPMNVRPILVLTGEQDPQQKVFFDDVKPGERLLVFGAVHTYDKNPMAAPDVLEPQRENDYRRWWNNPWDVVEAGGQNHAGAWTADDMKRLESLVAHAHAQGLWIRFYTLDGAQPQVMSRNGWFSSYNFGSAEAARERWKAAYKAGVDYIATDEYGTLAAYLRQVSERKPH
jgi:hypothetical protein